MVSNGSNGRPVSRLPVSLEPVGAYVVTSCAGCPMMGQDDQDREVCQHPAADNGIRIRGSLAERQPWCPLSSTPLTLVGGDADDAMADSLALPAASAA